MTDQPTVYVPYNGRVYTTHVECPECGDENYVIVDGSESGIICKCGIHIHVTHERDIGGKYEAPGEQTTLTDGGHNVGNQRWDTPCGIHHGLVFVSGVSFGLLIALLTIWVVITV